MPQIGLVTVLYHSNDVLEGFFKSLSGQSFNDYHLFLIDNTPSDECDLFIDSLMEKHPISSFTHIKNDYNAGVARGNNQGIERSLALGCTHTLLLNNDIEFENPNLLEGMLSHAIQNEELLVIPKILYFDSRKIWVAGGNFVPYKGIINHWGEGDADSQKYNEEIYCHYAPTCFMLIANRLFLEIGIMDEKYFVYYDDTDFIYRAHLKGYRIKYLPQLVVLHKVSSSTGGNESLFTLYWANRNRLYFIRKNLKGFTFFSALSFTLLTRIIKYVKYNAQQRKQLTKAVFDGLKL